MDELKEKLAALGLDTTQVEGVVQTVLEFIKDKLPDGMEGMVENLLGGNMPDLGDLGDPKELMDKAKGFFGGN